MSENTSVQVDTLLPLSIPDARLIRQADDAFYAVGQAELAEGLHVYIPASPLFSSGDTLEIRHQSHLLPVAVLRLSSEHLERALGFVIPALLLPEGRGSLRYSLKTERGETYVSEALQTWIKTTPPAPLPATELPDDVVKEGISPERAKQGVEVIIPSYPGQEDYDLIELQWGLTHFTHLVLPAEKGSPVRFMVNSITITEQGDGRFPIVYRVTDCAGNSSERWSEERLVNVFASGATLVVPSLPEAEERELDTDKLGGEDTMLRLVTQTPAEKGDTLLIRWQSRGAAGYHHSYQNRRKIDEFPPSVEDFSLPFADIALAAGGIGMADYQLLKPGSEPNLFASRRALYRITGTRPLHPATTVREARDGKLLSTLAFATIEIAPWPDMQAGDRLLLRWRGKRASGEPLDYREIRQISESGVGHPVILEIPASVIAPLVRGELRVDYQTESAGLLAQRLSVRTQSSEICRLLVTEEISKYSPPHVREAVEGKLDPAHRYINVDIAPWPGMAAGETVRLGWRQDDAGWEWIDTLPITPPMPALPVTFGVWPDYYSHAECISVCYEVIHTDKSVTSSEVLQITVTPEAVSPCLPEAEVPEATDGRIDGEKLSATLRLPDGVTLQVNDIVSGFLNGVPIGRSVIITDNTRVTMSIPVEVLRAAKGKSVDIRYLLDRKGTVLRSRPLWLRVTSLTGPWEENFESFPMDLPSGIGNPLLLAEDKAMLIPLSSNGLTYITSNAYIQRALRRQPAIHRHYLAVNDLYEGLGLLLLTPCRTLSATLKLRSSGGDVPLPLDITLTLVHKDNPAQVQNVVERIVQNRLQYEAPDGWLIKSAFALKVAGGTLLLDDLCVTGDPMLPATRPTRSFEDFTSFPDRFSFGVMNPLSIANGRALLSCVETRALDMQNEDYLLRRAALATYKDSPSGISGRAARFPAGVMGALYLTTPCREVTISFRAAKGENASVVFQERHNPQRLQRINTAVVENGDQIFLAPEGYVIKSITWINPRSSDLILDNIRFTGNDR